MSTMVQHKDIAGGGPRRARALVIDGDEQQSRGVTRALRAAISEVEACPSPTDVEGEAHWDLIAINYESLDAIARRRALEHFAEHNARRRLIFYSSSYSEHGLGELLSEHGVSHAIACLGAQDLDRLRVTACKSLDDDIFGLDKYLSWNALTTTLEIVRTSQRADVLAACEALAQQVGMRDRRAESFATLTDELLTNALYNAPTDAAGNHRYATLDRNVEVVLDPGEAITVTLGADAVYVAVSVSDPFGSVTPQHLIATLGRCMGGDERRPRKDGGGAGLGLFHAYQASSQLAFNIAKGVRTEAIGILDIACSNREFKAKPKSLDVFESDIAELSPKK